MLSHGDRITPLQVGRVSYKVLPRPRLPHGVSKRSQPGEVPKYQLPADGPELPVAHVLVGKVRRDEVVHDDAPGSRRVDNPAPDLSRLPHAIVRGVVLEADDERDRCTDDGDRQPRQLQPFLVEDFVHNDGDQRDKEQERCVLPSPPRHVLNGVVPLGVHRVRLLPQCAAARGQSPV